MRCEAPQAQLQGEATRRREELTALSASLSAALAAAPAATAPVRRGSVVDMVREAGFAGGLSMEGSEGGTCSVKGLADVEVRAPSPPLLLPSLQLSLLLTKHGDQPLRLLGEGSFGRVKLVRDRHTGEPLAMKCLCKAQLVEARQVAHVQREVAILRFVRLLFTLPRLRERVTARIAAGPSGTHSSRSCAAPSRTRTASTSCSSWCVRPCVCRDGGRVTIVRTCGRACVQVQGGELWSVLYSPDSPLRAPAGGLAVQHTRFYGANIVVALKYLHEVRPSAGATVPPRCRAAALRGRCFAGGASATWCTAT